MLSVADIRKKVNAFPEDKPVEELLDELMLLYKIERGLKEVEEGKGLSLENFNNELELWWKSK
ncbi:MAG TPA: hypothetical protein VF609_05450 [Flavisolibacter sp.]